MPYLFLSSLFLSQVAEALATCMFYFSGNTRARIPITRPLLGTRSLPGQLAESRLMCWAADSRLLGRAPAARVRGHWLVLRNFSLDCCWGTRLALRTAAEVGRRVWHHSSLAWTATPGGVRGEQLPGRTSAGREEPRQRPLLRLPPPLCIKCETEGRWLAARCAIPERWASLCNGGFSRKGHHGASKRASHRCPGFRW